MKAVSKKSEGSFPAKKVVKRVVSKGGTPPALNKSLTGLAGQSFISKKDDNPKPTVNQVKLDVLMVEEADNCLESKTDAMNVQVESKFECTSNKLEKKAGIDANASELINIEEKPKTKKVVKKKVIVVKKNSASATSSPSEPASTISAVSHKVGCIPGDIKGKGMPSETSTSKEAKPNTIMSEKPKKVIKKVIVRKTGSAAGPKKEKFQNLEAKIEKKDDGPFVVQKVDGAVKTDTSKSAVEEGLPQVKGLNKFEAGGHESEAVVPAAEQLQIEGNYNLQEDPDDEEDLTEEQGFTTGMPLTRPFNERQKRKKLEVFVGGLDKEATEDDLRAAFQPVGDVVQVRLMMNPVTGKNKGYAFVRFASSEQAILAATEYSAMQIRGKECGVLPNQDNDTLFIGNISRDWKSSEVLQKLKEYGVNGIEELTLIGDPQNEALNRGYAFLELSTHYDALNAFQRLQRPGVTFGYDRPARVAWAQPLAEADASTMSQVKSVFVDGLPPNWTEDMVKQNFGKFGEIERIVLARNMPFAKRKDFAFVNFSSRESALACIQAFNNTELIDGDKKVKVKVSLTRPLHHKGRGDKTFRYSGHPGYGRGRAGRGEGWFSTRFGERETGRGFGRSGRSAGMVARIGKRLYDEDEVRMLLKAAREQEGWPSAPGRGRGGHFGRASRAMVRDGYTQNDEAQYYDAEQAERFRHPDEAIYTQDSYSRPSNLEASRGNVTKPISIRDTYEPHYPSASGGRASQLPEHYVSPHQDGSYHHSNRYEQSPVYGGDEGAFVGGAQDYHEMGVGMKRPASAWDEDIYESSHRGYPRARVDHSDHPEVAWHYAGHTRSPAGPVTQTLGVRHGRSAREGPVPSLYESGSGLGKSVPAYNDHSYDSIPPETSTYPVDPSERRESSMYPSALYGGHGASVDYDFHSSGYY